MFEQLFILEHCMLLVVVTVCVDIICGGGTVIYRGKELQFLLSSALGNELLS
jgi:hypothetical protein